jgi:hypothetical protein
MVGVAKKPSLIFICLGVILLVTSIIYGAIYISYVGLGLIFWGIILALVVTELPSTTEEVITEKNEAILNDNNDSDIVQKVNIRLEYNVETIQQSCIIQETTRKASTFDDALKFLSKTNSCDNQSFNTQKQLRVPQIAEVNCTEQNSERRSSLANREMIDTDVYGINDGERVTLVPPLNLPDEQYSVDKEQTKKIEAAFALLNAARKDYENNRRIIESERIDPRLKQLTEQVRKCPLSRPDKQDCFFCEAQNCRDRKL